MTSSTHQPNRTLAASGSVVFHVLFVLIVLFSIKHCGSGGDGVQYLSLNIAALGEPDKGGPGKDSPAPEKSAPAPLSPVKEQPVETQDDAPVEAPKVIKPKPNTTPNPNTKPVEKPAEKPAEEQPKESKAGSLIKNNANTNANDSGKDPGANPGNSGVPTGSIQGKGIFEGSSGKGEWSLAGRNMLAKPSLSEKPKDEGKVVVDIWVDNQGNVVDAKVNVAAGNTTNSELFALAIKAAKTARFNVDESKGNIQKGTITIIFSLN